MRGLRRNEIDETGEANEIVIDTVLGLPVYTRQVQQYIFGLPAIQHHTIYMIDVSNEPDWPDEKHVLECDWGVSYL